MPLTGRWPIARPLYESADGLGAGAPDAAVLDAPPVAEDGGSLSDHEASYSPEARSTPTDDDAAATTRDEGGKFKPRHRAASQRADVDDVPTINAHTKRIKEAEAKLGADIARQDGESERAFTLRRRAELLERQGTAPAPAAKREEPAPAPRPAAPQPIAPVAGKFPDFDTWFAKPENADKTWDDYSDARVAHNYAVLREQERREDAQRSEQERWDGISRTYRADEQALSLELPDYHAVLATLGPTDVSAVVGRAVIETGPRVAYYLASHPDELRALTADTMVDPDNPAFAATVAATKRYLSTLVAPSQRPTATPSPRTAAAPTGSAPASRPPLARPPNPVRTGSIAEPDTPPDADDQSLASHERFFGRKRR